MFNKKGEIEPLIKGEIDISGVTKDVMKELENKQKELEALGVTKVVTIPIERYEELMRESIIYKMTYNILDDIMENHRMVDINYIINLLGSLFFEGGVTLDKED